MLALLFGFVSYFTWGSGVFFEAIAARRLNPYSLVFWSFTLSFIITSLYAPFAIDELAGLTFGLLILNVVLALVGIFFGTLFYYGALRIENRALIGTIASSFPIVTVILSVLFLGEKVSLQQIIAIFLVFIGLFLVSINLREISSKNFLANKGVLYAILAMLMWGAYFAFIKIPVKQIGWFWPNYIAFLTFPLLFIYLKISKKKLEKPTHNNVLVPLIVSTVLVRIAEFSYNLGINKGLVAIVAPIAGANPTLFIILAFLVFKDPIKKQQIVGIITTLIGIVLLSVFSV